MASHNAYPGTVLAITLTYTFRINTLLNLDEYLGLFPKTAPTFIHPGLCA